MEELLDVLVRQVMASIECDVEVVGDGWDPRAEVSAWLNLTGEPNRRLFVAMPRASAERLSSLVTGLTAAHVHADPSLAQDLAGEVANIMAGHLWPALAGATGLGLPQAGRPVGGTDAVVRRYQVGGDSLLVAGLDVGPA